MLIQKKYQCKDNNEKICIKNIQKQPSIFTVLKNFKDSAYGEIYITSFKMWQNNMITGIGLNNYQYRKIYFLFGRVGKYIYDLKYFY